MSACVRAQGREWCMCVWGGKWRTEDFPVCVCVHMCVLVRQTVLCVCVGEGHEGWREGFPETEPQRICLGKKEILWFDFIF